MKISKTKYEELMRLKGLTPEKLMELTNRPESEITWLLAGRPCTYGAIEQLAVITGVDPAEIAELEESVGGENFIEFLHNASTATVTFCQGRYITKIRKLAAERPTQCQILAENKDGSILATVPVTWVRIQPPPEYTEEQKESFRENAKKVFNRA